MSFSAGRRPRRRAHRSALWSGGTRINGEDRSDLPTLVADTDLDAQLRARIDGSVPGSLQHGRMQEHVPGAVSELDEAEPLLRVEPFYGRVECGTAWCCIFPRCPAERMLGRAAPIDGGLVIIVSAPSLSAVSSSSHCFRPCYSLAARLRLIRSGHINTAIAWICAWPSRRRKKAASPSSTRCRSSGAPATLAPPHKIGFQLGKASIGQPRAAPPAPSATSRSTPPPTLGAP